MKEKYVITAKRAVQLLSYDAVTLMRGDEHWTDVITEEAKKQEALGAITITELHEKTVVISAAHGKIVELTTEEQPKEKKADKKKSEEKKTTKKGGRGKK